ncbi:MAG TPA: AraC family transcriptional regulator [Pseudomonadales bacterium]
MTAPVLLNPPAARLGTINAVMGAAGRTEHHVERFTGPLSIKFMVRGSGTWRTGARVHRLDEGWFLVLNHGQTYSLDIEGGAPRESFCPFFRRGFVEDIHRAWTTPEARLLDDPAAPPAALGFHEHLHPADRRVVPRLLELRRRVYDEAADGAGSEPTFVALGEALLLHALIDLPAHIARVPAARAATRAECHRRLARAQDYLHANAYRAITLDELAAVACMSPYHFHRRFRALHGTTPHQYQTRLRLAHARRLLLDTERSITEIALAVGFDSPAAFSRRFRRSFGVAPAGFRAARFRKNGKAPDG